MGIQVEVEGSELFVIQPLESCRGITSTQDRREGEAE